MRQEKNLISIYFISICFVLLFHSQGVFATNYDNSSLHNALENLENDLDRYRSQAERTGKQAEQYRNLAENAENEAAKENNEADRKSWLEDAQSRRQRAEELEAESLEYKRKAEAKEAEIQALRERIDLRQRASERQDAARAQSDTEFNAARQQEAADANQPTRPPVDTILGLWSYGPSNEPFAIVQEDPEFEAYPHKLEAHTPHRVWKGNFHSLPSFGSMIELEYTPKIEEMNPAVPEWVRRKVEGELKWKIEIDIAGTCGTPRLIAAFYPGEIKWKDDGENDPEGAWVSGKGKARILNMEKSEPDASYFTYGSALLYLRLPGPRFDPLVNTIDGLIKGQRFHVDVILPPELAEKEGETLDVTIKGLKGNKSTILTLRRGAARRGRSITYTHYDPITIADPLDVQEEDRDAPFLSLNYILGYQGQRISLEVENNEMVEFSYREALQSIPVNNSWVQRKILRHEEAIDRLRPFYNMIIHDPNQSKNSKEEATQKLSMIRNYERTMESTGIHDYIRARIGSIYFHPDTGLMGMSMEDISEMVDVTTTYGQPADSVPDNQRAGNGVFQGVVWTSLYERTHVMLEAAKAREDYITNVVNELPTAMALALYTGVAGASGAGDLVTLFTGNDIFGKKVSGWERVLAGIGASSSLIMTFSAPHIMTPPTLKAFSPGHVSSRAMRAGARAKLKEINPDLSTARQPRNLEQTLKLMTPAQRASVMPPESPEGPPVLSDKPVACALTTKPNPTKANAPPPRPSPINAQGMQIKLRYGQNVQVKNPGPDPLLPPQEFGTCQCGSTMLSVKEVNGLALSEMLVFSILVKKGLIKPGVDMPLTNGYKDSQLVAFLETMGAEVMVIPTAKSGRRLTLEQMDSWMKKGWRIRDVVKTIDSGEHHAIEIRELARNANGDIDQIEWYDSAYGEKLTGPSCDYLNDIAATGFDTILYRWKDADSDASTVAQPTIEYPNAQRSTAGQSPSRNPTSAAPDGPDEFIPIYTLEDVLRANYKNERDVPPFNAVTEDVLTALKEGRTTWQPSDKINDNNSSFTLGGIYSVIKPNSAGVIRVKEGHENFVQLVDATNGKKLIYWKSGVPGEGNPHSYAPREHLQYMDLDTHTWTDFEN